MKRTRHFASDNYSGVCPEAWAAMAEANAGHVTSYGDDPWTQLATDRIRDIFETDCEVFFVFNGTAALEVSLRALDIDYGDEVIVPAYTFSTGEPCFKGFPVDVEVAMNSRIMGAVEVVQDACGLLRK